MHAHPCPEPVHRGPVAAAGPRRALPQRALRRDPQQDAPRAGRPPRAAADLPPGGTMKGQVGRGAVAQVSLSTGRTKTQCLSFPKLHSRPGLTCLCLAFLYGHHVSVPLWQFKFPEPNCQRKNSPPPCVTDWLCLASGVPKKHFLIYFSKSAYCRKIRLLIWRHFVDFSFLVLSSGTRLKPRNEEIFFFFGEAPDFQTDPPPPRSVICVFSCLTQSGLPKFNEFSFGAPHHA